MHVMPEAKTRRAKLHFPDFQGWFRFKFRKLPHWVILDYTDTRASVSDQPCASLRVLR